MTDHSPDTGNMVDRADTRQTPDYREAATQAARDALAAWYESEGAPHSADLIRSGQRDDTHDTATATLRALAAAEAVRAMVVRECAAAVEMVAADIERQAGSCAADAPRRSEALHDMANNGVRRAAGEILALVKQETPR